MQNRALVKEESTGIVENEPLIVNIAVNTIHSLDALLDTGCLSYGVIDSSVVSRLNLERVKCSPKKLQAIDRITVTTIDEMATFTLDVGGHQQHRVYLYIVPHIEGYSCILGLPWMQKQDVTVCTKKKLLRFGSTEITIDLNHKKIDIGQVGAAAFSFLSKRSRRGGASQVFSASMQDIQKALAVKSRTDPRSRLPNWIPDSFLSVFDHKEAEKLPPNRPGIDHKIELELDKDGKRQTAPWGPLYNMSREELLVLRKTLNEMLDKNFIRVSNSPAAAPVLFVRKPGGGLRFCCDYRALNSITRKDRYPLPLIQETLNRIGRAKFFTKLDVIAAFHKIRIQPGDEWLTAFRTRFGLYEWLVTPFGLANAPSTFQRYINHVLHEFLDEFCSAYVDDILIFTEGNRELHRQQVRKVLSKLQDAGLQIDIDKCDFEVQETRYLGFIVCAGKGLSMDPAKIKAIKEWEAPTNARGVLGFLGFANFYRRFIKDYSMIVSPLYELIKKDRRYQWTTDAQKSFDALKEMFTTAPILAPFDHELETILETDSSGWVVGGTLSQYTKDGILRPVAYFSKRNQPAECNYQIYDKELLAVVKCLEEWDAELRSVESFKILVDHKNLEYFFTAKRLNERQMRWQLLLSRYNFKLIYRQGSKNQRADALSRRQQDLPISNEDERLQHRITELFDKDTDQLASMSEKTVSLPVTILALGDEYLDWNKRLEEDSTLRQVKQCLLKGDGAFPPSISSKIKVSLSECSLDAQGRVCFRNRLWAPEDENLRTGLIQRIHDSTLNAHPGKNGTVAALSRICFWPNMASDIARFIRNCVDCRRSTVWREKKHGLLKPLPVPERIWQEISMDFIGPLPLSEGASSILVIVDRLSKGVILEPCVAQNAEYVAKVFLKTFYRRHGIPKTIVSDRGPQFVGDLWKSICNSLGIKRLLSTAFHPQTDGLTERMNAEVERALRIYINFQQDNWSEWLPVVEAALNNRVVTSTNCSPFFLSHGYNMEALSLQDIHPTEVLSPQDIGTNILSKIRQTTEWAQHSIAVAQQSMERHANKRRQPAQQYHVGQWVWLNLRNIGTERNCKKLDDKAQKFKVIEIIGSHACKLQMPTGVHNVFHVDLLRPYEDDPFPSQVVPLLNPPAMTIDGTEEYLVEAILGSRTRKSKLEYRVKWLGYNNTTWEPEAHVQDCEALALYLKNKGGGDVRG